MRFPVTKHRRDLGAPRKERSKNLLWHLFDSEMVTLSIQRVHDFMEAHEITDEWQILAIACLIWVCECSSNDVAKFANVAHVKATHIGIERKSPAHGSVCLLLRSHGACEVLEEERRDGERMIRKSRFLDDPISLGLAGEVG